MTLTLLIAVVASFALLVTALVTPVVRGAAIGMGLVRQARADRWHTRPTPAIGGVAIFVGFLAALGLGFVIAPEIFGRFRDDLVPVGLAWSPWEGLLAGASAAFLVGLVDDFVQLRPATKLAGQVAAATVLVISGISLHLTGLPVVDAAISVVWLVGITNALNLLDNMDGLAAGVAVVAGAHLTIIFLLDGYTSLVLLSLTFTGAVVGFLLHNYPPARIFMGDSGSLFLGLFLAGLALSPGQGLSRSLLAVVAVPALILAIPILDTTVVTVGRFLEGRPVTEGGKDHTSHRLVALGLPEERAIWILWGLAALGGGVGLLFRTAERTTAALAGGVMIAGLALVGGYFLSIRLRSLEDTEGRASARRVLVVLHRKFPVLLLLLDGLLVALAYYGAYLIRWPPDELPAELPYFRSSVAVVVGAKLLAFGVGGLYNARWVNFTLDDAFRVARAAVLGTLAAGLTLFLLQRTGLSRGVIVVDFLLAGLLLLASRLSFRLMEGAAHRLSREGAPAVALGSLEAIGLTRRALDRSDADVRMVAFADPAFDGLRGRVAGVPLFGGPNALANAIHDTGATAVVVHGDDVGGLVRDYLEREGSIDVFRLRISVERVDGDEVG